ncbi:glucuronyl hydrolase [Prolixibacteraceae bacterium JC049]|nr:glucuronyl hydrolase [Prolixibacteraceae bacterium JC049]
MKTKSILLLSIFALLWSCKSHQVDVDKQLEYCVSKIQNEVAKAHNYKKFPRTIEHGQTEWKTKSAHDWTSGFYPGILWNAYIVSKDENIKKAAEGYCKAQSVILDRSPRNHDLGFMIFNSHINAYKITGDEYYKNIMLETADSLASLYNPKVGTICSWPYIKKEGWEHNTIIDNMINLELMFWAAKNGPNKALKDIAISHARKSAKYLIRPDFTTYHVTLYDTLTGQFIKGVTHQGYADNSMWARGQGWGVYGFTMAYRETGMKEFLRTAEKLADVFLKNLPEDGIPYWDFNAPDIPNAPKDASAAALVASGLIELSQFTEQEENKSRYLSEAKKLLTILSTNNYLSNDKDASFLQHSTGHKPKESEVDVPIVYADYYYLEALIRLKGIK